MIPESIKRLANDIKPYLNKITNQYSDIEAIWLFGSRANGDHNQKSDWDLFVFANNSRVLNLLKADKELKSESEENNIDLFVVSDGKTYKAPWKRPGEENKLYKEGSLDVYDFGWKTISEVEAEYRAIKNDEVRIRKVWRIWPENEPSDNK